MGNFPQRRPGPNKGGNDPKRQKTDQGAWGGNWNSFGGGGFQQNNGKWLIIIIFTFSYLTLT